MKPTTPAQLRRRLCQLEAAARARRERQSTLSGTFAARFCAYFANPAIADVERAERVAFLIGFMAPKRDEESMLWLLAKMRFPDPAAALAQGIAFYRQSEGMLP